MLKLRMILSLLLIVGVSGCATKTPFIFSAPDYVKVKEGTPIVDKFGHEHILHEGACYSVTAQKQILEK